MIAVISQGRGRGMARLSLNMQILAGFLAGIIFGLFFGELCSAFSPIGTAFIKIWQITVIPSVVISLIMGIGGLKPSDAREIVLKAGAVLLAFWVIGLAAFFAMQMAFPQLEKASFFSTSELSQTDDLNIIDMFIPSNPFHSLSDGLLPAIVIFCIFVGFALIGDEIDRPFMGILTTLSGAFFRINRSLMRTFPIGIFVITAETAGTLTIERFILLQVFLISLAVISFILGLLVLPMMISSLTTFSYRDIFSASSKAVILGFSTGSEFIALPFVLESVKGLFIGCEDEDKANSYSEVLVPVAYTFPLMGSFVPFLFILFVAWFYSVPMDITDQIKLILIGIPSFFGSSKVAVDFLLSSMHLPSDAFDLYISTGILRQSFVAALSSMSIFTFTAMGVAFLTGNYRLQIRKLILSMLLIIGVFALAIICLKLGFASLIGDNYHGGEIIESMDLPKGGDGKRLNEIINTKVYLSADEVPAGNNSTRNEDPIKRIEDRGALRVGYDANDIPFVFFNKNGSLVGYDVQTAYELAQFLGIPKIEFVPIKGDTLAQQLDSGQCDIVMSCVVVTPKRLESMRFTDSYMTVHMAFVVKDERKKEFLKLADVQKSDHMRIAVLNRTALVNVSIQLFPNAKIIKVDSIHDFFAVDKADALFTTAEEGSVMTLLYPFYTVALFQPSNDFQMLYAYPVAKEQDESFLLLLNYWLKMEKEYGQLDNKYDYWILGKNVEVAKPRWSVAKDVLHWVR